MITIYRQKQLFSFLPISISINNSEFKKITTNPTQFENDKTYIEAKIKFLGLRKNIYFSLSPANNTFDIFMNIEKNMSYVIIAAIILCFGLAGYILYTSGPSLKLIAFILFPLIYLLRIFQSINIKPKE